MTGAPGLLVSVCVANYNGALLLSDCLDSVLAQALVPAGSIEIIVHDDASTDDSVALLRDRYPAVKVIASTTNVGFCVSNNRMAEAARGEFLLLLNNDAALFPDAIHTLLAEARRDAGAGLLTLPQYEWDSGALINLGCRLDPFHHPRPILRPDDREATMLEGACLWIDRATWQRLGGFPESFGSIAEDAWLCLAARLNGVAVRCLGSSGFRHRQGTSFGGNRIVGGRLNTSARRRRLSERNRIALLVSCTPTPLVWPWLAIHLAAMLIECMALCLWMRSLMPWREIYHPALRAAWSTRRTTLTLRRRAQAMRTTRLRRYLSGFDCLPRRIVLLRRHGMPTIRT